MAGSVQLLCDDRILAEYAEVLARPKFGFSARQVRALLNYLRISDESVLARPLELPRTARVPDKNDLPFAEVAAAGRADALVTGNPGHFSFLKRMGMEALSPATFLGRWRDNSWGRPMRSV
jgi:predicted nucleic acid-binding protein